MAKNEKATSITKEQLEKIQSIVSNINQFNLEIGRIETRKHAILHQATVTQEALNAVQDELKEEYGTVNVSIEDGTIQYPEDEQTDKED